MEKDYIDIYCERTGSEFWSEPVNALSNFAFIFSAIILTVYILKYRSNKDNFIQWIFVLLIYLIGLGSFSFHTFANSLSLFADVVPIALFIVLYTWYTFQRLIYINSIFPYVALLLIIIFSIFLSFIPLYGSQSYLGALLFLFLVGFYLKIFTKSKFAYSLIIASFIFLISISFRTLDQIICGYLSVGTHFMWHFLNSILLFIVTKVMIDHGERRS